MCESQQIKNQYPKHIEGISIVLLQTVDETSGSIFRHSGHQRCLKEIKKTSLTLKWSRCCIICAKLKPVWIYTLLQETTFKLL